MSATDELTAVEAALVDGVVQGVVELDVIAVSGADAVDYLQGQLSQDVATLNVGETRWTLLLQPQGKVEAWMRLYRADSDRLWLIVEAGFGDDALNRLERFKLRVDVTMSLARRRAVALRGPGAARAAEEATAAGFGPVDAGWGSIPGVDLVGGAEAADGLPIPKLGVEADAEAMELIRILQGRPLMGRELDTSTIPAAAGVVDDSVDFTKGCYVGQELVARIDSRGSRTPTRLVRVRGPVQSRPPNGSTIVIDDTEVGTLTSAALSPAQGLVGLAYVKRAVTVPGSAELVSVDGASVAVQLLALEPTSPE